MPAAAKAAKRDGKGQDDILLSVQDLKMYFPVTQGIVVQKTIGLIKAVDNISFDIKKGETLGLVGESGCGKTTTGRCILQLNKSTSGSIYYEGRDLNTLGTAAMRDVRKEIQVIFQDPYSSLNPRMSIGEIIGEGPMVHKIFPDKGSVETRTKQLLSLAGLPTNIFSRYPHELSGGQRQRVGIARALSMNPRFIVCDEAVSALDVSIQAQIINLLEELQQEFGLTYLFIAHDLSVVRHISNRVVVMYLGKIAEVATSQDLYKEPLHPYTIALLSAVPIPDPMIEEKREHIILEGEVPSPLNPPSGCVFHTRCPKVTDICRAEIPVFELKRPNHWVACHHVDVAKSLKPAAAKNPAAKRGARKARGAA
ncbi:MAG: ATP-binding cassette domain-containing protein [SAR324 cluster bacterium]|nr:ATP-binding cassette domain-containing protein [SAR324 cluster bacterium]